MDFDLEGYRDERGALQLRVSIDSSEIRGCIWSFYFKKGSIPTPRHLLVLKEQTEARCPVANMMHASGCKIDIEWKNGITTYVFYLFQLLYLTQYFYLQQHSNR
jgi:hypothetical protein